MSAISERVAHDERFQNACQRYAHHNGSSQAIAAAALNAAGIPELLEAVRPFTEHLKLIATAAPDARMMEFGFTAGEFRRLAAAFAKARGDA